MTDTVERVKEAFGEQLDRGFYISLKNRYLYVQTYKVASTTLKTTLSRLEIAGSQIPFSAIGMHPDPVRSAHVKPFQLPDDLIEEVLLSPKFVRFCFVRHPLSRALSAYLDQMRTRTNKIAHFRKRYQISDSKEISFDLFVSLLHEHSEESRGWDPHWRPQFFLLRPDLIDYSMIGRIENFDEDYGRLTDLLDGRLGAYELKVPHKTGADRLLEEEMSPLIRSKFVEIYKMDFAAFDFSDQ